MVEGDCMIFDTDTHMSPYRNFPKAISASELDDRLAEANVDKALCWLLPQDVDDVSESNQYIYESCKTRSRFVPFGWANIMEGEEKALRDTAVCMDEYGFRGVKLNGAQNYYPIDSLPAMHVCEQIAKRNGIIAFHIGYDEPLMTSPFRAATVAQAFPQTPIIMVHMGGASSSSENASRRVIDVAKLCPNMYLTGSAIETCCVQLAIEELGAHRVMYGSDVPFGDPVTCIQNYREMLKSFPSRTTEQVMYETAKNLLL